MNKYDSQIIAEILENNGINITDDIENSDAIIINTCSVRKHAENRVLSNVNKFGSLKKENPDFKVLIVGCMAERLGENLKKINKNVDSVFPPYTYRHLPAYLKKNRYYDPKKCNPFEIYNDVYPKLDGKVNSFVAIMRGCNNFCSYCIVPYVRGRERSRPVDDVISEINRMVDYGYKEVILLGQNVNSYKYNNVDFPKLLEKISSVSNLQRIRFLTSHPKDLSDKLLSVISENDNISKWIHLPLQSGSNKILNLMNRNYTREQYLKLVEKARKKIDNLFISTDIISGFPGETDKDHKDTLDIVEKVRFESAFTYKYSPREGTQAYKLDDDVPEKTKVERLNETASLQRKISKELYKKLIGTVQKVLLESVSKKRKNELMGKTDGNIVAVVPKRNCSIGDLIDVKIIEVSGQTLRGKKV